MTLSPEGLRRLHLVLTILWVLAIIPVVLIRSLRQSVPLLVGISIYANVAGHFAAWQAARVEVNQDEETA